VGALQYWETWGGANWRKSAVAVCWVAERDSVPEPACLKFSSDESTARKSVTASCCLVASKGAITVIGMGKTLARL
jgi:hypothetical protein